MSFSDYFTIAVIVAGLPLAFFLAYNLFFIFFCFLFRLFGKKGPEPVPNIKRRFAVLVPAHNEEQIIGRTIDSVRKLDYDPRLFELFVVADNCTDRTASIVDESGVGKCLVRNDPAFRGKPYALQWALQRIDLEKFDAVTIIDADAPLNRNYLNAMNRKLEQGCEAVQSYFTQLNPDDSWLTSLGNFPDILKYKIRYYAKERLGLPCPLMGEGMCFSRGLMKRYGWNCFSITENWEYYVNLILDGHHVHYAEEAMIFSYACTELSHGEAQRKRWFKGRLGVLKAAYRRLLKRSLLDRDIKSFDTLVELAMPSYSMMLNWNIMLIAISGIAVSAGIDAQAALYFALAMLAVQASFLLWASLVERPSLKSMVSILRLPQLLAWKLVVVAKGLLSMRDKTWEKTRQRDMRIMNQE